MKGKENPNGFLGNGIVWEIPIQRDELNKGEICGTLVLDVDGTLTVPGQDYAIEPEAIITLSKFLKGGGNLIFCTGASLGRIERTVLTPLYNKIDHKDPSVNADELFKQIIVMPENGSALLLHKRTFIEENEVRFDWFRIHELHTPDKERLRKAVNLELVPKYPRSYVAGDYPNDQVRRDYILSLKKVTDTLKLKEYIEKEMFTKYSDINWEKIGVKAARTTIDFIHSDSGKTVSVEWVLRELDGLGGPVLGFGDLGDEFAKVIPTINVNKKKPNEFRRRGMPSMDLVGGWNTLDKQKYVVIGKGQKAIVHDLEADREITVLRDEKGEIIYTEGEGPFWLPSGEDRGMPLEIMPVLYEKEGKKLEVDDAGKGTAWIIERFMAIGYFTP